MNSAIHLQISLLAQLLLLLVKSRYVCYLSALAQVPFGFIGAFFC